MPHQVAGQYPGIMKGKKKRVNFQLLVNHINKTQKIKKKQTWKPMLRLRTCAGGGVAPAKRDAAIKVPVDCKKKITRKCHETRETKKSRV